MQEWSLATFQRGISTPENIPKHGQISLCLLLVVLLVFHFDLNETLVNIEWCALQDLNLRPLPCEGSALPLS